MEISGRLSQILPVQTGMGKNGEWRKCSFIIDIVDSKFPKKVCLLAWKDLVDQVQKLTVGSDITVSIDLESREFNGKWYTDAKAWKISAGGSNQSSSNSNSGSNSQRESVPMPMSEPPAMGTDDLPF